MLNNSEFLRTFAAGMLLRSGAAFLTALALRASAVLLVEIEATRFCLVHLNPENSKLHTRRSTTVHVYTWACRLMVCMQGLSGTEVQRRGIRRPTFRVYTRQHGASL